MSKTIIWMFWNVAYLFRPKPTTLMQYVQKGMRTRSPWWKFKPNVWHNRDGKQWHITFEDERNHTKEGSLKCRVHIGVESKRIVGLTVYDETLTGLD
jgi:hypothetical protein